MLSSRTERNIMPRFPATLWASMVVCALFGVTLAGCASKPFRNVVAVGDDTRVEIDDPRGIDTWSVLTSSPTDVVVLRLTGMGVDVGALRVRVLLPGDVVVAQLSPPRGE